MTHLDPTASIDDLLDRAVRAVNDGDLHVAQVLAARVLTVDTRNVEAGELLSTAMDPASGGQLRRLTIVFCDLVESTALSARHEPELYGRILGRYKRTCKQVVEDTHGGHIAKVKGDGLLALFGYPAVHEDDVQRAVRAGLDVVSAVRRLSDLAEREIGESLAARVGVHRGLVYLDPEEDDIYGLAANVAARLHELAPPGGVVISEEVLRLVDDGFTTRRQAPRKVKGLEGPLSTWQVVGERPALEQTVRLRQRETTPLVGRDEPLRRLRSAWAARPGAVLLRGEAGVGKSRLAEALAAELVAFGARTVALTASSPHAGVGFHPLRRLIEQRCRIVDDMAGTERLSRLRRHLMDHELDAEEMLPLISPVLGLSPDAGYPLPAADARKLLADITDALAHYLVCTLGNDPAMLLVEDTQWLDDSTRQLLSGFLRDLPHGLLVVMTGRDAAAPAFGAEVIELGPLSERASAVLVDALDAGNSLTTETVGRLVAYGDGIPLYLEHLVRAAIELPSDSRVGVPEHLTATTVPEVLYQPLLARLAATAGGMQLAGAAATIGRETDRALLAQVVDLDDRALDDALATLVDGSILEPLPGTKPPTRYRFRHELLREVAYELQPPSLRRRVHGRVADALAPLPDADGATVDWQILAGHNERADRPAAALDCYRRSAEAARRRGALSESRADLDRAVALLGAIREGPSRNRDEVELRLRRGFLAVSAEGNASPAAAADYERCLELATSDPSSGAMFTTLVALWGYYASRAHLGRARQVLELLRAILEQGRQSFGPVNEAGFGMLDWFRGRFQDAHDELERAAAGAAARDSDDVVRAEWFLPNDPTTAIYTHLALARFMRGDPAGAKEAFALAARLAADLPFPQGPFSLAYNLTYASWVHVQMGELAAAERRIDAVQAVAEQHGFDFWSLAAATQRAELEVARAQRADRPDAGALAAHADTLAGLASVWQMIDTRVFLPAVLTTLGDALGAAGDTAAADERLAEALALAHETDVRFCTAETLRVRAGLATDPAEADRQLGAALAQAKAQGAVAFQLRIARDRYVRFGRSARGDLMEALSLFAPRAAYPELDGVRDLSG